MSAPTVTVAEDSVLLREGLCRLLVDAGFEVVAAVGDGEELLRAIGTRRPDVVVADVRMPPTHSDEGLRAALLIRSRWPEVEVLASPTSRASSRRCTGSAPAAPPSTPRSSRSCWPGRAARRRSRR